MQNGLYASITLPIKVLDLNRSTEHWITLGMNQCRVTFWFLRELYMIISELFWTKLHLINPRASLDQNIPNRPLLGPEQIGSNDRVEIEDRSGKLWFCITFSGFTPRSIITLQQIRDNTYSMTFLAWLRLWHMWLELEKQLIKYRHIEKWLWKMPIAKNIHTKIIQPKWLMGNTSANRKPKRNVYTICCISHQVYTIE